MLKIVSSLFGGLFILASSASAQDTALLEKVDKLQRLIVLQQAQIAQLQIKKQEFTIVGRQTFDKSNDIYCQMIDGIQQSAKKVLCPGQFPYAIAGGCELREGGNLSQSSSSPVTGGKGWECRSVYPELDCADSVVKVWAICTSIDVDASSVAATP